MTTELVKVNVHPEDWATVRELRQGTEDYADTFHQAVELLKKERKKK
jgi:hypothetical protein